MHLASLGRWVFLPLPPGTRACDFPPPFSLTPQVPVPEANWELRALGGLASRSGRGGGAWEGCAAGESEMGGAKGGSAWGGVDGAQTSL